MRRTGAVGYLGALAVCFAVAMAAGWTSLGVQIDNDFHDFLPRVDRAPARPPESVLVGIDERTYAAMGGLRNLRRTVAETLEILSTARPKVVAVDLILAGAGDPAEDARLAAAIRSTRPIVLASDLTSSGWEEPHEPFLREAAASAHVHADPDPYDNVVRRVPLEKAYGSRRRWAMALEVYRLSRGLSIEESPGSLRLGAREVPLGRTDARSMLIRFRGREAGGEFTIPHIPIERLKERPELARRLAGKVVFVGYTAQAQDRHMTPNSFGQTMPGVEIHANAFETLVDGSFLRPASHTAAVLFCAALAAGAGLAFHWLTGWTAYLAGAALLALAHAAPVMMYRAGVVFPFAAPAATAWLTIAGAATFQHFLVRRRLRKTEADKLRYRQAIHFVTHEMRSPLTAIQGSSELMGRHALSEEKRRRIAEMIHSESRRLARMIETFLDVERLTEGQMELERSPVAPAEIVATCVERARPLAERKRILLETGPLGGDTVLGDRELIEYAVYNLLTNAIKYSPAETTVTMSCRRDGDNLRLSVRDQGMGMDAKEASQVFQRFYRTRKAEVSGEAGTGIGLSIVEQIVVHHGGRIEVESAPGKGSCFTIVLAASVSEAAARPR